MNNRLKRRPASLPGLPWQRWLFVSVTMILLMQHSGIAQNFIVNGSVNNAGTIRVKNQTVIAQPGIGGELILTGADQVLPAKNFHTVTLNGSGTKSSSSGNFSVSGNLTIAAPVTLRIPQGDIVTLGDTLFEFGGLRGAIQKSVDLTGSTTSSNFGNIGATISWSSNAPGVTNVLRASDSMQIANGNQSVKRYYSINTADTSAVGNVLFKYSDAELNGHDTTIIELWQSNDNGNSWKRRPAVVDAVNRTIAKSNVPLAGLWAIADTTRPLGPLTAAGVPAYFTTLSAPAPQSILTQVQPLTVIITDAFGDPVAGISLSFAITAKPDNATGDTLSVYSTVTDSLGRASTQLTLGNKIGTYSVTATSASLNPIVVNIRAYAGAPAAFAVVSGNNQADTLLTPVSTPLIVSVRDIGDNPVESTVVVFAIAAAPQNATGQVLSADTVMTDSSGNASVALMLGNKPGTYTVSASAASIPSTQFVLTALKNSPSLFARISGNAQSDTILSSLDSALVVSVKDIRGNPVDSASVQFAIISFPQGATGQTLSTTVAMSDTAGIAIVSLTLGNKVGLYSITGTVSGHPIPAVTFSAEAVRGPASSIQILAGSNQTGQVLSTLQQPFVISLADIGGNAAVGDTVFFSFVSVPPGAEQQQLSAQTSVVGSDGLASTQLTLGNKTGQYVVGVTTPGIVGTQIFTTTAIPGSATAFASVSGSGQRDTINAVVPNTFDVTVVDALGNGVPNANVTFAISSVPENAVGQQLSATNITTDANGTAATQLRFGNKVGTYVVTASAQGIPDVQISASASAGAASAMIAASGQSQVRPITMLLDTPFVVNVLDVGSNNVPGTAVVFTLVSEPAGATGTLLADSLVFTDSLGTARTYLQLGNKVGEYRVNAKVVTVPMTEMHRTEEALRTAMVKSSAAAIETEFVAHATHGAAASFANLSGSGQSRPTETRLDSAFTLTVFDIGLNPVPNTPVSFTIVSAPSFAQGHQVRDSVAVTDSAGVVSNAFTLGDMEGTYTIAASVDGVTAALFTANAYFLYGDLNKDIDINIADITTYIDYLLKEKNFTYADSIKADINKDSTIDAADIELMKESILNTPIPLSFIESGELTNIPRIDAVKTKSKNPARVSSYQHATASLEATPLGLRVNLHNEVPVRGVEMRMRLIDSLLTPAAVNLQFTRAKQFEFFIRMDKTELRLLAFNASNTGIEPGTGPIFRIAGITDDVQIDTVQVLLSVESNLAVQPTYSKTTAVSGQYPVKFSLKQNYPNPFNGSTTITYDIPDGQRLIKSLVQVYNLLGQKVKTLVSKEHDPGTYTVVWDGTDENGVAVSSGVYFYRLITKNYSTARKMIYVK